MSVSHAEISTALIASVCLAERATALAWEICARTALNGLDRHERACEVRPDGVPDRDVNRRYLVEAFLLACWHVLACCRGNGKHADNTTATYVLRAVKADVRPLSIARTASHLAGIRPISWRRVRKTTQLLITSALAR